jgi:hypothetical protein
VITPHLFGTVTALSYDGEGFLFESAGPFGTGLVFGEGGSSSIGTIGIAAGFLLPAVAKAQDSARRASCMGNTRQLGLALIQYAGDHDDAFPPTLGVLLKDGYLTTTKVFMCPSAARRLPDDFPPGMNFKDADLAVLNKVEELGDYVFVKGITHAADADAVVLYEKDGAHGGEGRNVFFNDGHCKWYPEAGFQRLLKAGLKGE